MCCSTSFDRNDNCNKLHCFCVQGDIIPQRWITMIKIIDCVSRARACNVRDIMRLIPVVKDICSIPTGISVSSAFVRTLESFCLYAAFVRGAYIARASRKRRDKPEATLTGCFSYFLLQVRGTTLRAIHGNPRVSSAAWVKGPRDRIYVPHRLDRRVSTYYPQLTTISSRLPAFIN